MGPHDVVAAVTRGVPVDAATGVAACRAAIVAFAGVAASSAGVSITARAVSHLLGLRVTDDDHLLLRYSMPNATRWCGDFGLGPLRRVSRVAPPRTASALAAPVSLTGRVRCRPVLIVVATCGVRVPSAYCGRILVLEKLPSHPEMVALPHVRGSSVCVSRCSEHCTCSMTRAPRWSFPV